MADNPLGKNVTYPESYEPALLVAIPRAQSRVHLLSVSSPLPFAGADIWNAYELSWLNSKGKPQVARGRLIFPCTSPNLIESKSLKLYLNSLNQHTFESMRALQAVLATDLSLVAEEEVTVQLESIEHKTEVIEAPVGVSLDEQDIECKQFHPDPGLLTLAGTEQGFDEVVDEVLYSNLFRSNCPITNQPDWATVTVCYQGKKIAHSGLLQYLVSYRQHNDYHENCVERIYCDISERCQPQQLVVEANFLRRGGLDINPVRSSQMQGGYSEFPRYIRQ